MEQDRAELLPVAPDHRPEAKHIEDLLKRAEDIIRQPRSLREWWCATSRESAFLSMREAEAEIDLLLTGPELDAHARDLLVMVKTLGLLSLDDERVKVVTDALNSSQRDSRRQGQNAAHVKPVEVAHLARAAGEELYERHNSIRAFRNRLVYLVVGSTITLGLMLVAFILNVLQLRVTDKAPSYIQVGLLVSLFGAVGALITAVPPLARTPRVQGKWNPFSSESYQGYQMLLKIALGPLFAIIGVILLQAELIPNVTVPMSLWWTLGPQARSKAADETDRAGQRQ